MLFCSGFCRACSLLDENPGVLFDGALVGRTLDEVAELTKTCPYCGSVYELPPEYVSGKDRSFQTVHPTDRKTRRPTGQVITIVANLRVHECWQAPREP